MVFTWWFIVVGAVFLLMALSSSLLARLPLSTAMLYLGVGVLIGPHALGLITIDPIGSWRRCARRTRPRP